MGETEIEREIKSELKGVEFKHLTKDELEILVRAVAVGVERGIAKSIKQAIKRARL